MGGKVRLATGRQVPPDMRKAPSDIRPGALFNSTISEHNRNIKSLLDIKGSCKNQRCWIGGTGPSLADTNLDLLKGETIFGVNTLFRAMDITKVPCSYWAMSDRYVTQYDGIDHVYELAIPVFLGHSAAEEYHVWYKDQRKDAYSSPVSILGGIGNIYEGHFSKDLTKGLGWGGTVILDVCLQVAYWLGFSEVVLFGCDSTYGGKKWAHDDSGTLNCVPVDDEYFQKVVFPSYRVCREVFEADGRKLYNATVGGVLPEDAIPRKSLEDIIDPKTGSYKIGFHQPPPRRRLLRTVPKPGAGSQVFQEYYIHSEHDEFKGEANHEKIISVYEHSVNVLEELHDKHAGERCFVVATGPSLEITRLDLIRDEVLFGMNTLYTGLDRFGITCKYWGVSDPRLFEKHWDKIDCVDTTHFLTHGAALMWLRQYLYNGAVGNSRPVLGVPLEDMLAGRYTHGNEFSTDPMGFLMTGGTVVMATCLQMAYHMGFSEVCLLGCDCDYSGKHRFDGMKSWQKKPGPYQGWQKTFEHYGECREAYEAGGRKLYNATAGGKLPEDVLERVGIEELV